MRTTTTTLLCLALAAAACGDTPAGDNEASNTKGADPGDGDGDDGDGVMTDTAPTGGADDETGPGSGGSDPTTGDDADSGEPQDPGPPGEESCDAGDEAWVKRVIPLLQGRKPEGMREVRLLVGMIEQLDAKGADGRAVVARGLTGDDLYRHRWKTFLWEQLRINRIEVKSNYLCYSQQTAAAASGDLAAFIRDNDALGSSFAGGPFTMGDVLESALRLDDISPLYRADMFARMATPLNGANISQEEFEVNARSNFGEIFESAYLGRRSGCLECHNSEASVTYNPDPKHNRHWAIPGNFERAIYGAPEGRDEAEVYAAFRWTGFVEDEAGERPWGMSSECGTFVADNPDDILDIPGYLGGELPEGQDLFDIDPLFKTGFAALAADGLTLDGDLNVGPDQALAYLTAVNLTNNVWTEMMGYPLTLATGFPRNEKQREILVTLSDAFIAGGFSLRALLTEIVLHPYFNADAPDACGTSNPYFMQPVFDPFSISSSDPSKLGNGVGDRVQRYSAWVLVESAMRAMWWDLPIQQAFKDGYPGLGYLRDQGIFVKDAQNGFNGVDFNGLLSWESNLAAGYSPGLEGDCTGPLGGACADYEWIELMLTDAAGTGGVTIRDLAAAIKDRLITEPTIDDAELAVIAEVFGLDPAAEMSDVPGVELEAGARRYAGLILGTPQFMLSGVPSRDQDPSAIPAFAAPGTDTESLCNHLAPLVLGDQYKWSCSGDGVAIAR